MEDTYDNLTINDIVKFFDKTVNMDAYRFHFFLKDGNNIDNVIIICIESVLLFKFKKQSKFNYETEIIYKSLEITDLLTSDIDHLNKFQLTNTAKKKDYIFLAKDEEEKLDILMMFQTHLAPFVPENEPIIKKSIHDLCANGTESEIDKYLYMSSSDSYAVDLHYYTPLSYAIIFNRSNVVEKLVDLEFPLDRLDKDKNNYLHLAAKYGDCDIIKFLIHREVPLLTRNSIGHFPIYYALIRSDYLYIKIIECFLNNNYTNEILDAQLYNETTIANDPSLTEVEKENDFKLIHKAVLIGDSEIVRLICKYDRNVNRVFGLPKISPLHLVAVQNYSYIKEIIFSLLINGAYPNFKDDNDSTPADVLMKTQKNQKLLNSLLDLLNQYGGRFEGYEHTNVVSSVDVYKKFEIKITNDSYKYKIEDLFVPITQVSLSNDICKLCQEKFGLILNRSNTCACCKLEVCNKCYTKTFPEKIDDKISHTKVCDSCFNRLCTEFYKKENSYVPIDRRPAVYVPTDEKILRSKVSDGNKILKEAINKLSDNVDKAKIIEENSKKLSNSAANFNNAAQQLLEQFSKKF